MSFILIKVLLGIALLLALVLWLRIHAFLALLISSIAVGLMCGLDAESIMSSVQKGMAGTLGFVATVVGLGAILGGILERAGGVHVISQWLLQRFGEEKAPLAMLVSGFLISIPVFFDVAFIILVPVLYGLQRRSGKSLLLFSIPLLAGLAITHAFIPPTPGPVAVADIVGASLGHVILVGGLVGIPTAIISGLWFGKYISKRIHISAPSSDSDTMAMDDLPSFSLVISIIAVPILLILLSTFLKSGLLPISPESKVAELITLFGHPFIALILANLRAWYMLGIKRGYTLKQLSKISQKSLEPAGTIILLTGAGGVFKQILVDTQAGTQLAELFTDLGIPVVLLAFLFAALIRLIQGSATVAMITGAGLVSPLLASSDISAMGLACVVIASAAGASIFSHVNDSGFWLVSQYLKMDEKQTFQSWSMMTLILALSAIICTMAISVFV